METIPIRISRFGKSTCLLRFSSESTESADQGRSPGFSDFCWPSHPNKHQDNGLVKQKLELQEGVGITVAGTAPVLHRIPFSSQELKFSLGTFIRPKGKLNLSWGTSLPFLKILERKGELIYLGGNFPGIEFMNFSAKIFFSSLSTRTYAFVFGTIFLLFSCEKKSSPTIEKTQIPLSYAQGFEIFRGEKFWEIQVTQGFSGAEKTYRYLVLEDSSISSPSGYDAIVKLPISGVALTSTTQIPHLDILGETKLLKGFPNTDLVSSKSARRLIDSGEMVDLGNGPSANPELVIDLQPSWIMISTLGDDLRYLDLLNQAGIPAFINGEYVEQHPLGRAEWIKFTGILLGKYEQSVAEFEKIEQSYLEAEKLCQNLPDSQRPKVLSGVMYQDIWYAPGAESWGTRILQNAGGDYIFSDQSGFGSLQLNYEFVLDRALEADFWIGSADFPDVKTMGESEPRYQAFTAWKKGNIYTYTAKKGATGGLEYFELGYVRPDLILKDLIKILHPELLPDYELYFYQKLP